MRKSLLVLGLAVALASPAVGQSVRQRVIQPGEHPAGLTEPEESVLSRLETIQAGAQTKNTKAAALCRPTIENLCLLGRFAVIGAWRNPFEPGSVRVAAGAFQLTDSSGYLWFFSPAVIEVPVKLLNFCAANPPVFKLFAAGLSDFEVVVGVLDFETGIMRTYVNVGGHVFDTIIDQQLPFPCP